MRLIITFFQRYPVQSILTLLAMLFAGIAEGFGMAMLLPLLGMVEQIFLHSNPNLSLNRW